MALSLLFEKKRTINLHDSDLTYDPGKQINMVNIAGELSPAIDQEMRLPTNSKTNAAPGDDDPDPGRESLY